MAELHRPDAGPRLPVPAVGGVAAASSQCARRGQLDPVAGGTADDRRRAALIGVPELDRRPARARRRAIRPWQYTAADRNPAVPARQPVMATDLPDRLAADPHVPSRDAR